MANGLNLKERNLEGIVVKSQLGEMSKTGEGVGNWTCDLFHATDNQNLQETRIAERRGESTLHVAPGLFNCKAVTLLAALRSTPSHHPAQQSLPAHVNIISVVSLMILTLKLTRAALSASEHTPALAASSLCRGSIDEEDEEDIVSRRSTVSHLS